MSGELLLQISHERSLERITKFSKEVGEGKDLL